MPPPGANMFLLKKGTTADGAAANQTNEPPIIMFLKGRALNYRAVADYLAMLRSADLFADTQLKRSGRLSAHASGDIGAIVFEIECQMVPRSSLMGIDYADIQETKNL